jgi:hypothetical protein
MCMTFMNVTAGDFIFENGQLTETSQEAFKNMLRKVCAIWTGVNGAIPRSQASSSLNRSNNQSSSAGGSSTNLTIPTTGTSVSRALIQTSGSSAQSVIGSHNADADQPLPKRSRPDGRTGLMHTLPSNSQLTTGLAMPMPARGVQGHFLEPMQAALQSGPGTGTQMSMTDYAPMDPEQWPMEVTAGFMEPNNARTNNIGVFQQQSWPPGTSYGTFQPAFTPIDQGLYFPQTPDFGQERDMDGDMRSM